MTTPPPGPYGQPGEWQQGGYGGYGPGYGQYGQYPRQPPPPPPKKKTGLIVAVVVIAVLVLGGAGVGIYVLVKDDGNGSPSAAGQTTTSRAPKTTTEGTSAPRGGDDPAAGDCIKVIKASSTDAEIESIDCAEPDAVYRIGKALESSTATCPDGDYVEYTEIGANSLKLCLMLNAKEGDCFKESDQQDTRADCGAADFKISKVIEGSADADGCGADDAENALIYAEPPTTLCRVAAA